MKLLTMICLLMASLVAHGHNNHFYPGDAYFSSWWHFRIFEKPADNVVWQYEPLTQMKMDCGNGGVSRLVVMSFPEKYRENMKKVDEIIKNNYIDPANPKYYKRLLIYDNDYDFEKFGVAYRYNENWVKEQLELYKMGHAKYDRLGGQSRVIQDWRDSRKVKGLRSTVIQKNLSLGEDPLGDGEELDKEHREKMLLMNQFLEGNAKDFAFVVLLSNTVDRMIENTYAELSLELYNDDAKTRLEKEKKLKHLKDKPSDLFKFMVITEKIRLFEEQQVGEWKITEVKTTE